MVRLSRLARCEGDEESGGWNPLDHLVWDLGIEARKGADVPFCAR
jgi:hypothetical protein